MSPPFSRLRRLAPAIIAGSLVLTGGSPSRWLSGANATSERAGTLVAYEPMPTLCVMPAAEVRAAMRQEYSAIQAGRVVNGAATPERTIKDPYPSFAGVSVDPVRNEVVFTDESLFQVLVYDRMANTPAGVTQSEACDRRREDEHRVSVECLGRPEDRRNLRGQQRHPRHHRRVRRRRQRQCSTGAQHCHAARLVRDRGRRSARRSADDDSA